MLSFVTASGAGRILRAFLGAAVLLVVLVSFTVVDSTLTAAGAAPAAAPCDPGEDPYECEYLELYGEKSYRGDPVLVPKPAADTCVDLDAPVVRATSSVYNGQDMAVLFYAGAGCTGSSYRFGSYSGARDLTTTGLADSVSVKFVTDVCDSQPFVVCLYKDAEFLGDFLAYPRQAVNACLQLPAEFQQQVSSLMNNLQDVGSTRRQDVLIFSNTNCTGNAHRQNAWTGHPDLSYTTMDNQARSIKFVIDPCRSQQICLWTDVLYDGAAQVIGFQPTNTCTTLNSAVRGQVSSIRQSLYYPDQDVLLYTGDNCTGTSKRFDAGTSISRLSEVSFDNQARSVKFLLQDP
ncbi:peptidase inhibitor family I36 protein [Actinoplanes sp. TRM 88003]|uniref:Peptidase inhibitor family I36 protein n=1 Tax=Paractinoplanes aksuensis TaxID=2939490 RepID=A0ABT1DYN5_9ACTN|nr:peptidase inhibitor family I36 protein [Actinoplanes aksuensis]MCO8276001.1 peptidase inhibitor family I36 protein [Actinoplanes aksuensis]